MIGGSGPILSVNYDRRFQRKVNGFDLQPVLNFYGVSGLSIFSVPVSIDYLLGRNSHFMEIVAGTTFISASAVDLFSDGNNSGIGFIHHINAGYRYQPTRGGFFFRGGISPLFIRENMEPLIMLVSDIIFKKYF